MKQVFAFVLTFALTPLLFGQNASPSDEKFADKAAQGGKSEVELGQLAVQKASDDKVKQFGQKMVDDHTKSNQQLQQVADQERVTLPSTMEPEAQAEQQRLSKLSGPSFDKAYMRYELKDHQKDVADFRKEATTGKNSGIKSFAQSSLPTLQEHLKMAQQITPKENMRADK